ncbi:MAG TPA: hypothetical protein VFU22_14510 [Roseiflexaceae bacterium]|nr:hypothetical protein [Roseiflexaceae bacterium]
MPLVRIALRAGTPPATQRALFYGSHTLEELFVEGDSHYRLPGE